MLGAPTLYLAGTGCDERLKYPVVRILVVAFDKRKLSFFWGTYYNYVKQCPS